MQCIDDIFGNCETLEFLDLGASVSKISYKTIRQLKVYRQSLIYEAVTGKIEV